jgi:hypothetical protein
MAWVLGLCFSLLIGACQDEPTERGVAARVNGKPIAVRTLEFVHALSLSTLPLAPGEILDALKAEYGQALAGLVVEELVTQDLAKRGMEVTEAELKAAETTVRSGYPGRTFEDTLAEEGIDLDIWRERLKARVSLDAFAARVLRPRVRITPEEAQNYYKEHAQEFAQPATVRFVKAESSNAESLRQALDAAGKAQDPTGILDKFETVSHETQAAPEESLPKAWREALKGLKPGQAGAVVQEGSGYQAFILLERSEAKAEGLVQAYPLVEKRLAEDKMAQEFSAWLAQTLTASVIEINPGLVPEKGKW